MSPTDTSEKGLETLIVEAMTVRRGTLRERGEGGPAWQEGDATEFDRAHAVDLAQLRTFLQQTQPQVAEALDLDNDSPTRLKFLARLEGQIAKHGTIEVLRKGIKHGAHEVQLFFGTPSPGNQKAAERYEANRFTITRQVRYSEEPSRRALDLVLFLNGLPIATFELKNSLTKQTVEDAVEQYRRDRDPRERLFRFGRCLVHFAVDDSEVRMCTELKGKSSWFLPFNKGWNDGAGNPPNPKGVKTAYLWEEVLAPPSLVNILENYAQVVKRKDERTGRTRAIQFFPRYHQLDVVRKLLADVAAHGVGRRYLIQHSAGSGKSNSIAWLAHQLVGLPVDSVIVVTDRRVLDRQIRDTIKGFTQVGAIVGHAERSGDLRRFLQTGKKIIVSTVQKFPFILDEIGSEHRGRKFAIIIDEAHSSQGGRAAAAMNMALSEVGQEEETVEERIIRIMEGRKMLSNASYFAFTATPKNRTLELFGEPYTEGGKMQHRPFHSYTMKQAIQEGFILDVLRNYTPVASYYHLTKTVGEDPEFDAALAQKKLRRYVERHEHAIRLKAEIMVDHFHEQVVARGKIGGQARAMVVTGSIAQAIQYYHAIRDYLVERRSPYRALVAFSGEHEVGGRNVTESTLNGFPSNQIEEAFQAEPYRFLVCADKFRTGYDEPLLHTMYVDKPLAGVRAVQTLSRLNRAHPQKHDTFVLDFFNDADTIRASFEPYYRATILSDETDANKLHDLQDELDRCELYFEEEVGRFVGLYLGGAARDQLDPLLDTSVARYLELDEAGQVGFKGRAKAFTRTYNFLATILPYSNAAWERLAIFLDFLLPKLPAPIEEDLARGILELVDMDSYRAEKQATMAILLADQQGSLDPVPTEGGGGRAEPELDRLSNILRLFNDLFGNVTWNDEDRVRKLLSETIPNHIAADTAYQNARRNSDAQNTRVEYERAFQKAHLAILNDDIQLFKLLTDNEAFRRQVMDAIFALTHEGGKATPPTPGTF